MNIIITGVTGGIGSTLAQKFCQNQNLKIIGIARNKSKLEKIADHINKTSKNANFFPIVFDLIEVKEISTLKVEILKIFTQIDVLINNVGILVNKPFEATDFADLESTFQTNFYGPYFLIQGLLENFNKNSHILNISSMGGVQGSVKFPGLTAYSASKAALSNLTECLAEELKAKQIFVNAIAPGSVQTEMLEKAFPGYKAATSADDMADFIADFALKGHKFFNGKILPAAISTP